MKDIVIEVKGGAVMDVYSDIKDARFVIVDWDRISSGEGYNGAAYVHAASRFNDLPAGVKIEYRQATK